MEEMTDNEFDLLDELYFVQSYSELKHSLDWSDHELQNTLISLMKKEFIKFLSDHDTEYIITSTSSNIPFNKLFFLATKKGLMIHNGY